MRLRRPVIGGPLWLGWLLYCGEVGSAVSGGGGAGSTGARKSDDSSELAPFASVRGAGISKLSVPGTGGSIGSLYGSASLYGSLARGPDGRCPRPRRKGRRRSFIKLWCGRESSSETGCRGWRGLNSREVPQPHSFGGAPLRAALVNGMVHLSCEIVQQDDER